MAHLQSMFVLLLIGESLALVTLIVEVVMRKIILMHFFCTKAEMKVDLSLCL
jgi:hypothetical protein